MTTIVVPAPALQAATGWAVRIVPARPVVPILAGILLDATTDRLHLSAFDYDTSGATSIAAHVDQPGRLLLSGRLLAAIVKTVPRTVDVTISDHGDTATVRAGRSEWVLPTLPAVDYPQLPTATGKTIDVDADQLGHALARVQPAASPESEKASEMLRGIRIEPGDGHLDIVATDRYRLAHATIDAPDATADLPAALIPAGLVDATVRALPGQPHVTLTIDDTLFGVTTGEHRIAGRQIAEEFPSWRRLIPAASDHQAVVAVNDLHAALAQLQAAGGADTEGVQLHFADGAVQLEADGDHRAHATIDADLTGEATSGRWRVSFLRDMATAVATTHTVLHLYPARKLLVAAPCGDDLEPQSGYQHLVMETAQVRR